MFATDIPHMFFPASYKIDHDVLTFKLIFSILLGANTFPLKTIFLFTYWKEHVTIAVPIFTSLKKQKKKKRKKCVFWKYEYKSRGNVIRAKTCPVGVRKWKFLVDTDRKDFFKHGYSLF